MTNMQWKKLKQNSHILKDLTYGSLVICKFFWATPKRSTRMLMWERSYQNTEESTFNMGCTVEYYKQNIGKVAFFVRVPEFATKLKCKTIVYLNDTRVLQFLYSSPHVFDLMTVWTPITKSVGQSWGRLIGPSKYFSPQMKESWIFHQCKVKWTNIFINGRQIKAFCWECG